MKLQGRFLSDVFFCFVFSPFYILGVALRFRLNGTGLAAGEFRDEKKKRKLFLNGICPIFIYSSKTEAKKGDL